MGHSKSDALGQLKAELADYISSLIRISEKIIEEQVSDFPIFVAFRDVYPPLTPPVQVKLLNMTPLIGRHCW